MSSVWEGTRTEAFMQGVAMGAENQRRRIVQLLEAEARREEANLDGHSKNCAEILRDAIALINEATQ